MTCKPILAGGNVCIDYIYIYAYVTLLYWKYKFSIYSWKQQQSPPPSNDRHIIHSNNEAYKSDRATYPLVLNFGTASMHLSLDLNGILGLCFVIISQIYHMIIKCFMSIKQHFVINTHLYWKPMKIMCYMFTFIKLQCQASCIILNSASSSTTRRGWGPWPHRNIYVITGPYR